MPENRGCGCFGDDCCIWIIIIIVLICCCGNGRNGCC